MKKLTYLFVLASALIVSSCSSDDDSGATISNSIKYGTEEASISTALIEDYGGSTNYNYDFSLTGTADGKVYTFYAELYSPVIEGNVEFRTGTFSYILNPSEPAFYFNDAYIEIDGVEFGVDGGTITVSGSGTNYTFTTNVMLANDVSVEVTYDGEFTLTSGL